MKSAVETLNPTRVKLTVEVPFDELKPSLDAAYRTIANQVTVPGFRKGKVPPRIIDQRFGRGVVLEEAVNDALPRFYARAVEESEVRPLGQPQVDVTEVPDPAAGGDLKFTAEVDVRPTITLPDLSNLEVTVDDAAVTDEDVDTRMDSLRARFGTLVPVERPAEDGDFVTVDLRAEIGGDEIDSVSGVSYHIGSGNMLEGMDEALTGLSAGETTTFSAPLAGGEHAGESAEVTLTLQTVKIRELPALDDDFAQLASEFDSLDELRADLREQAADARRLEQVLQARERLLDQLLDGTEIPVPDALVEEEVHRHLESEHRLEDEEHRAEVEQEARKGFRTQLLLDAIAEEEKISVAQQELIDYLVVSAQQYGMDPNEFAQAVDKAGQVPSMVGEVARRKALVALLNRATVKDASGNPVDVQPPAPTAATDAIARAVADATGESVAPAATPVSTVPAGADPTAVPVLDLAGFEPVDEPADEPAEQPATEPQS